MFESLILFAGKKKETICMKCQILFSRKNKNKHILLPADVSKNC